MLTFCLMLLHWISSTNLNQYKQFYSFIQYDFNVVQLPESEYIKRKEDIARICNQLYHTKNVKHSVISFLLNFKNDKRKDEPFSLESFIQFKNATSLKSFNLTTHDYLVNKNMISNLLFNITTLISSNMTVSSEYNILLQQFLNTSTFKDFISNVSNLSSYNKTNYFHSINNITNNELLTTVFVSFNKTKSQFNQSSNISLNNMTRPNKTDENKLMKIYSNLSSAHFHSLFYDDANKIIYCEVPKVACTNWKRVLLYISGKVNVSKLEEMKGFEVHSKLEKSYLKRMDTLNLGQILARLEPQAGYFKFIFVRQPLERLLSAYRNKFASHYSLYFHNRFGKNIIKNYRFNASKESLEKGNDVTLKEFVFFLLDRFESKQGQPMNAHWRSINKLCLPCLVSYDFIGKYETIDSDVRKVLNKMGLNNLYFPPAYHTGNQKTVKILKESFSNITSQEMDELKKLYQTDYQMFYKDSF